MTFYNEIFIFLFFINFPLFSNIIIIPFNTYNPFLYKEESILSIIKNAKDIDIIDTLSKNLIYTNLSIGKEKQNYHIFISLNTKEFYLKNLDINNNSYPKDIEGYENYTYNDNYILKNILKLNYYNSSLSSTYKYISDKKDDYYTQRFSFDKGVYANELFFLKIKNNILEKEKIKPINLLFTYRQSVRFDHRPGVIGLGIKKNDFLRKLKSAKEINNCEFSIKYNDINEEKGEIIIGDSPHIYDDKNYKEKDLRNAKVVKDYYWEWSLIFTVYIQNNNYNFKKNQIATFKIEQFFILGTKEYFELIQNIFFNKYIDEKICYLKKLKKTQFSEDFFYFICNIEDVKNRDNILKNFPSLIFYQREMSYNFTLVAKDLFTIIPDNKRLLFNIEFNNETEKWEFGKPFFKKYHLVFDSDSKLIKYYINSNSEINQNNINDGKIFMFFILTVIIFFFGILLGKLLFNKYNRKIRANELEDNYSYNPKYIKEDNDMKDINSKKENFINNEKDKKNKN